MIERYSDFDDPGAGFSFLYLHSLTWSAGDKSGRLLFLDPAGLSGCDKPI